MTEASFFLGLNTGSFGQHTDILAVGERGQRAGKLARVNQPPPSGEKDRLKAPPKSENVRVLASSLFKLECRTITP